MRRIAIALLALITLVEPGWAQPAGEDADRHMTVARYYAGRGDHSGAVNRLKLVLTQYQGSPHVEEALARITEAYLALGIARAAQNAAAVLIRKFPNGRWAAYARDALTAAGLTPVED
jgi:outer membrane protein assembly factor BamD